MVVKRANIEWISPEEGGRASPPTGPRYSAPVQFLNAADTWPDVAWDLVVDMIACIGGPERWLADVHFRVEAAPQQRLADGVEFQLYEGRRCVARGHVIAAEPPP